MLCQLQGDNASSVLFLYIMLAATDTIKTKHIHHSAPTYSFFPDNKNPNKQHGHLVRQPTASKGTTLSVDHILYVDDGAFISTTRDGIESMAQALYDHLAKFGLKMHVGKNNEESKTLAMLIPPSLEQAKENIRNKTIPPKILLNNDQNNIPFTNEFKYLGSIIHVTLQEDVEIERRIKQAWSVIGVMKHFLTNRDVDLRSKVLLYMTGPLNALLWGCESWNLSKKNIDQLNIFHHSAIRWILGIRVTQVKEERIKNTTIRKQFGNIQEVSFYIKRRTWTYIGKIIRANENLLPRQLTGAWIQCPRKIGHPQKSCRNLFVATLKEIIPENVDDQGKFKDFFALAKNETLWEQKLKDHEENIIRASQENTKSSINNKDDENSIFS